MTSPAQNLARPRARFHLALALSALFAALALLAGCGSDDESTSETTAADGGCTEVSAPAAKEVELAAPTEKEPTASGVVFETNCGSFTVALDPDSNPQTAASFQYLASEGAYDDTRVNRVADSFVVQAGDPTGTGSGGSGYSITETPPQDTVYARGVVAMAKASTDPPGTSSSQFFVVTAPADAGLPPDYAVVGTVDEAGMETVAAIEEYAGQPGVDGPPTKEVVIETATVEE